MFQKIVTATVTKKPDITKIQTQLGDAIGLNFDDKTCIAESTYCMCSQVDGGIGPLGLVGPWIG